MRTLTETSAVVARDILGAMCHKMVLHAHGALSRQKVPKLVSDGEEQMYFKHTTPLECSPLHTYMNFEILSGDGDARVYTVQIAM